MDILAMNASPNRSRGNTGYVLEPFLDAAREAGASVETLDVYDLNVAPCRGCWACWQPGGDCSIADDMTWVRPKIAGCDVWVLGAPLYVDAMPGPLKTLIDRMVAVASPQIELVDGHCRHPRKPEYPGALEAVLLVSVCGFWEADNFDPLVAWARAMCRNLRARFAGALLRPHAYAYRHMPDAAPGKQAVREALVRAGRELVETGAVSEETQAAVAAPLMGLQEYLAAVAASTAGG
jgi:hypothetical protein